MIKNEKFISSNKINLDFKIDVDALSEYDINAIVNIVMNNSLVKPFNKVIGIPSGGLLLEKYFKKFENPKENNILIVDDVLTTGNSVNSYINKYEANQAFVVFNRNLNPNPNVISFFNLNSSISYIKE